MFRDLSKLYKISGSCSCSDPNSNPILLLSVSVAGRTMSYSDVIKGRLLQPDSADYRFLTGERIPVQTATAVFCLSNEFIEKRANWSPDPTKLSPKDWHPLEPFLHEEFEKLARYGEGIINENTIDYKSRASIFVPPDSLAITNVKTIPHTLKVTTRDDPESGKKIALSYLYQIKVRFTASTYIIDKITPKPLDYFRKGVNLVSPSMTTFYEIALGITTHHDEIYVNDQCDFAMLKPKTVAEFKDVLFREATIKDFNFFKFAALASAIADDPSLQSRLCKYSKGTDLFSPSNYNRFYQPYLIQESLDDLAKYPSWENFKEEVTKVYQKMVELRSLSANYPSRQTLAVNTIDFCSALLEFYSRYMEGDNARIDRSKNNLGETVTDDYIRHIFDKAWENISMDPVSFIDYKSPIISKIAKTLL